MKRKLFGLAQLPVGKGTFAAAGAGPDSEELAQTRLLVNLQSLQVFGIHTLNAGHSCPLLRCAS